MFEYSLSVDDKSLQKRDCSFRGSTVETTYQQLDQVKQKALDNVCAWARSISPNVQMVSIYFYIRITGVYVNTKFYAFDRIDPNIQKVISALVQ